jgi:hypothetical protein
VAVSVVAGGIFTPGYSSKFRLLHAFLSDQACPGALKVHDHGYDHEDDHDPIN